MSAGETDITRREVMRLVRRGVGEVMSEGATAAIANAIHHTTGKRVRHFPITADDLLA
jgi:xanthine dehydrogenase YagR molybdenum-binding subunit